MRPPELLEISDPIFNVVSYSPNPYESKKIVELYGGYLNMVIFLVILVRAWRVDIKKYSKNKIR